MTRDQRVQLLGAEVVAAVREESRRAAEEYPPGPDVIEALRPILTSHSARNRRSLSKRLPAAA